MDSIRFCNLLKKNTESLLQICGNQIQSHNHITSKRKNLSIAQHKMYLEKATTQNPTICIFHKVKTMKQYNVIPLTEKPLHSIDCLTLI